MITVAEKIQIFECIRSLERKATPTIRERESKMGRRLTASEVDVILDGIIRSGNPAS